MHRRRLALALVAIVALALCSFVFSLGPASRDGNARSDHSARSGGDITEERASIAAARDRSPSTLRTPRTIAEAEPGDHEELISTSTWGDAARPDAATSALLAAAPVPDVSPSSDEHVDPAIENTCAVDLELFWVDFEGAERSYGVLEAGAASALSTFRGHVWRARDLGGTEVRAFAATGEALSLCDDAHGPSLHAPVSRPLTPGADPTVSARSIQHASLTIANTCDEPLALQWVHFDGTERAYGVLAAGDERSQETFDGHLWRARRIDGTLVSSLVVSGDTRVALCGSGVAPDA